MKNKLSGFIAFALIWIFATTACKKDDDIPKPPVLTEQQKLNRNFYDLMKDVYYWYENIPEVDPKTYKDQYALLDAIRYNQVDSAWSFIMTEQEYQDAFVSGQAPGIHGFKLGWQQTGNQTIELYIAFIYNDAPLYARGVRRGWKIVSVNGVSPDYWNETQNLLGSNLVGVINEFVFEKPGGEQVTISDTKGTVDINAVLHSEVMIVGGKKVGYLVYETFISPSVQELEEAFSTFNTEGIEELVLDLRYNGGGDLAVCNTLASYIAGNTHTGEVFSEMEFNNKINSHYSSDDKQYKILSLPNAVNINHLYVLVSSNSASASEAIINGLEPILGENNVLVVGTKTHGKPMGMSVIPLDNYRYAPITFKLTNKNGVGDYFGGIAVDREEFDDFSKDWGNVSDPRVSASLYHIQYGTWPSVAVSAMKALQTKELRPYKKLEGLREIIGAY